MNHEKAVTIPRAIKTDSVIEGPNASLNFFSDHFYIHGDFDSTISAYVIPHMVREIEAKKKVRDATIRFYIDSNGGYTSDLKNLLSLFEMAKSEGITVETYVFAKAYSCGSVLAAAGTKGSRFVGEHAEHLCHLGNSGTWARNDTELSRETARSKSHFDWVRSIYKRYATIKNLEKAIHDDGLFIGGKDIVANGLADKII